MSVQIEQKKAAEQKSKSLLGLLSAAFCKKVEIDLRGIRLVLKQPKYQDVLNVQLDTIKAMGDMRNLLIDPESLDKMNEEKKESLLEEAKDIRDKQNIELCKLCCEEDEVGKEFKALSDEMINTIIYQTGGDHSPLIIAVKKLTGTYENDLVQDDPFFRR